MLSLSKFPFILRFNHFNTWLPDFLQSPTVFSMFFSSKNKQKRLCRFDLKARAEYAHSAIAFPIELYTPKNFKRY